MCIYMKMNVIKWDESMAVRCVKRIRRSYAPGYIHHEDNLDRSFQAGEWDDFKSIIENCWRKRGS